MISILWTFPMCNHWMFTHKLKEAQQSLRYLVQDLPEFREGVQDLPEFRGGIQLLFYIPHRGEKRTFGLKFCLTDRKCQRLNPKPTVWKECSLTTTSQMLFNKYFSSDNFSKLTFVTALDRSQTSEFLTDETGLQITMHNSCTGLQKNYA